MAKTLIIINDGDKKIKIHNEVITIDFLFEEKRSITIPVSLLKDLISTKQLKNDLESANTAILKSLQNLRETYNLPGIEFVVTSIAPNYIGVVIDVESEAFKSYF